MNTTGRTTHRRGAAASHAPGRSFAILALAGALAVAVAACQTGDSLAGPTWEWTTVQHADPAGQAINPDPDKYTIEFLTDGTVKVEADCNSLTGTYAVGIPLDLTIDLSSTTMAACGDASLDDTFLESLGQVASYATTGGTLHLEFGDDAGAMQFKLASS